MNRASRSSAQHSLDNRRVQEAKQATEAARAAMPPSGPPSEEQRARLSNSLRNEIERREAADGSARTNPSQNQQHRNFTQGLRDEMQLNDQRRTAPAAARAAGGTNQNAWDQGPPKTPEEQAREAMANAPTLP